MAVYEYVAKKLDGTYQQGKLHAQDRDEAWAKVRTMGLFPVKMKEERGKIRRRPLSCGQLSLFMGELTVMLHSGIPLAQAMYLISNKESQPDMKNVYDNIYHRIIQGLDFSQALSAQGGLFPPLLAGMIRAGEAEGCLWEATKSLADYYEKEDEMRKKIGTAMVYPAFLCFTVITAMVLLFTEVLPRFFVLFESMETIPASTRLLMTASYGFRDHFTDIIAVLIAVASVLAWIITRPGALEWKDRLLLHVPLTGTIMRTIVMARFARTFSFLYSGGVPFVQTLEFTCDVLENRYIKARFLPVLEEVCNGRLLSEALSHIKEFSPEMVHSIYIGEESGSLDIMLEHMAESLEARVETVIKRFLSLLEPILIIVMAFVIGYLMLSVMVPIYQYYQSIG